MAAARHRQRLAAAHPAADIGTAIHAVHIGRHDFAVGARVPVEDKLD